MPDFLSIPGNIRQQYMPFTISGPGKRQVFSFKDVDKKGYPNARQIHPFSKWAETLILNDSGVQYTHGPNGEKKVKFDEFLDEIPALQIREYVPDAKLTQTFKWFSYFKKGFDAGLQNLDDKAFTFAGMKEAIKTVMDNIGKKMKELTSGDAPLLAEVVGGLAHLYQDKGYNIGSDNGFAVLFLPFIMYYRLTTTHTNNVYEIPYSMQNEIMKSDGTYGWSGGNQSDFGLMDKAIAAVGENPITKLLLGNTVKVNMMPSFQPTGEARGESFTINIDLINDSDEAAINNFLMCHTLFGNNRWLQYGFVQAGASLYDVKLPGANRYFMCSGQFSCKGKGAFRTPSATVCDAIKNCAHPKKTFVGFINSPDQSNLKNAMVTSRATQIAEKAATEGSLAMETQNTPTGTKLNKRVMPGLITSGIQFGMLANKAAATYNAAVAATIPLLRSEQKTAADIRAEARVISKATSRDLPTAKKMEHFADLNTELASRKDTLDKAIDATNKAKQIVPNAEKKLERAVDSVCQTENGKSYYNAYVKEIDADKIKTSATEAQILADKNWRDAETEYWLHPDDPEVKERYEKASEELEAADKALAEATRAEAIANEKYSQAYDALSIEEKALADNMEITALELQRATETAPSEIQAAEQAESIARNDVKFQQDKVNEYKEEVIEALRPEATADINAMYNEEAVAVTSEDIKKLIKIPDVYSLTLTFNSLLPDNFNNYLYGFRAGNLDPIENYARGTVSEIGVFEKLVQQLEKAME